jgi:hypothetical protein
MFVQSSADSGLSRGCGCTEWHGDPGSLGKRVSYMRLSSFDAGSNPAVATMPKTEAWWVCNTCHKPLIKPGGKSVKAKMLEHRKTCYEIATFSIQQVTQGKK